MKGNIRKNAVWLVVSAVLVLADQLSKKWAQTVLAARKTMSLIDGVIGFRYAENTGAAFSALSGATVFLSVFSLAICIAIAIYMIRSTEGARALLPLSMILAGGVGNLMDRVSYGYVVDFFELQFMKFAIFNVADICITAGAALLFAVLLFGGEKRGRMDG